MSTALTLIVIPAEIDAQVTPSVSCANMNIAFPLEDLCSCAEHGDADLQLMLGDMCALGVNVPEDYAEAAD